MRIIKRFILDVWQGLQTPLDRIRHYACKCLYILVFSRWTEICWKSKLRFHGYFTLVGLRHNWLTLRGNSNVLRKENIPLKNQRQQQEVFYKKSVLKNLAKKSQENICGRVSFLIKLQTLDLQFNLKKRLWHRCFSVNFAKFLRTPFL